jgi:transglutaminase-like putative cysteine protease
VTRGAFRAPLDLPRPASAVLLVCVSTLTLAITGQVSLPVLTLQAAALAAALALRERPFAVQHSGWLLNLALLGAVVHALALVRGGAPWLVALAHFATLASGLTLLDARPRRSEFLLVVIALFQVVLASNLTDSVFFPLLLAAFLFSAVWTLLVHTLRVEALEAGDPLAATRALGPALLRLTLMASVLSLVLALGLFLLLPRLTPRAILPGGGAIPTAVSGFSDRVELGDVGRIRDDATRVLRVDLGDARVPAEERYWRGLAFDRFDGRSWSISTPGRRSVSGSSEAGLSLSLPGAGPLQEERVVREPVESGVVFGLGDAVRFQGAVRRLERDANGGLYAPGSEGERMRYTLTSRGAARPEDVARDDRAAPPEGGERFLALPDLAPAIADLAAGITRGAATDLEKARRIESHLQRNGRYTDTPPALDPDSDRSPVEAFLLGALEGHCEYFASAMVVLARQSGLPARLVNGFAGGRTNPIGGFVEVARSDAHAWVEIHFASAGWVRFDPTPAAARLAAEVAPSLTARLADLASALELLWFERVVDFDRRDQIGALRSAWLAWRPEARDATERARAAERFRLAAPTLRDVVAALAAACAAVAVAAAWRARAARRGLACPSYAAALRLLARRGLVRAPATPARHFARSVAPALPPEASNAFATLTDAYLAERFGGAPSPRAGGALRSLRDSLRA